jgi:hypothetical protein
MKIKEQEGQGREREKKGGEGRRREEGAVRFSTLARDACRVNEVYDIRPNKRCVFSLSVCLLFLW